MRVRDLSEKGHFHTKTVLEEKANCKLLLHQYLQVRHFFESDIVQNVILLGH